MRLDTQKITYLENFQAKELLNRNAPIYLPALQILPEDSARILAYSNYAIVLRTLPALTAAAAEALAAHRYLLAIPGLISICRETGDALSQHKGPLQLGDALKVLMSARLATRLVIENEGRVCLDGLRGLSADVASGLTKGALIFRNDLRSGRFPTPEAVTHQEDKIEEEWDDIDEDLKRYDEDGYDEDGYDVQGYDRDGFNEDGFDRDGFDARGYNDEGYDRHGDYIGDHESQQSGLYEEEEEDEGEDASPSGYTSISLSSLNSLTVEVAATLIEGFRAVYLQGLGAGRCSLGDEVEQVLVAGCKPKGHTGLVAVNRNGVPLGKFFMTLLEGSYSSDLQQAMLTGTLDRVGATREDHARGNADDDGYDDDCYESATECEAGKVLNLNFLQTLEHDQAKRLARLLGEISTKHGFAFDEINLSGLTSLSQSQYSVLGEIASYCGILLIRPKQLNDPNILAICSDACEQAALERRWGGTTPFLDRVESIDAETAAHLVRKISTESPDLPFLDLNLPNLKQIDAPTAKAFTKLGHANHELLLGVSCLSTAAAEALVEYEGCLSLPGLTELPTAQSNILTRCKALVLIPKQLMPSPEPKNFGIC